MLKATCATSTTPAYGPPNFPTASGEDAVRRALAEDATADDMTTRWSVPRGTWAQARIITREAGILAGLPVVTEVYRQVDPDVTVTTAVDEMASVRAGDVLVRLDGPARSIITGERTALNFLQRLSGIATMARHFVDAVGGVPARILDTRKTAPGLRTLDKYAVTAGGASNHRLNLSAMVLLKENHIEAAGGITAAIDAIRAGMTAEARRVPVEVEVRNVAEAEEALRAGADWIMLDNMSQHDIAHVVALRDRSDHLHVKLEASGTVTIATVRRIAQTGVDAISIGALTHSVHALDLSLLISPTAAPPTRLG
ncbi:carboxylating nicotinate-nucleotide diphosphorylase [Micromonospora sp. NPDC005206]|uniref:carboxylating nicotinate-nucleotide diphosphorylase n=1 Tax=Micromonospora sp. NPDC005206 TaxID=3157022 RepID=UPI0033A0EF68